MKTTVMSGAVLVVLGLLGLAIPVFTTSQTKDVVKFGDLKIQANEQKTHVIPPILSEGAIALGAILIVVGIYSKR
jgi:hypothetical protein